MMLSSNLDPQSLYLTSSASTSNAPIRGLNGSSNVNPYADLADALVRQGNEMHELSEKVYTLETAIEEMSKELELLQAEKEVQRKISESFSKSMDLLFYVIVFLSATLAFSSVYCLSSLFGLDIFNNAAQTVTGIISVIGIGALLAFCKWLYGLSRINKRIEKIEDSIDKKNPDA